MWIKYDCACSPSARAFLLKAHLEQKLNSVSKLKLLVIFTVNAFKVVYNQSSCNFNRIMDLRKDRKRSLKVLEQQEAEIERIKATKKRYTFIC